MAYKIEYTPQDNQRYPMMKQCRRFRQGNVLAMILLVLVIAWVGCFGLPEFLIPGDPLVTKAAAAQMVTMIKDGTSTQEAIAVFCRQVLDGATK